jgi:hypothetical protein
MKATIILAPVMRKSDNGTDNGQRGDDFENHVQSRRYLNNDDNSERRLTDT